MSVVLELLLLWLSVMVEGDGVGVTIIYIDRICHHMLGTVTTYIDRVSYLRFDP